MIKIFSVLLAFVVLSGCEVLETNNRPWEARGTFVTTSSLHDCYMDQVHQEYLIEQGATEEDLMETDWYLDTRTYYWNHAQSVIDSYNSGSSIYRINQFYYNQGIEKTMPITYCNSTLF